jgi:probable rRNA maturation factor
MYRIDVINAHPRHRLKKLPIRRAVRRVLREEHRRRATVSVVCVGSHYCRRINRKFLGHDAVTDVLSFPLADGNTLEGEIYINLDRARQQAHQYRVSFTNEATRLVVHGVLHLVGYDDANTRDRRRMKVREDEHVRFWFPLSKG